MVECGLTPDQFWNATWYELYLLSEQARYQQEREWNHTRHLMAAMGAGKGKPKSIMSLPTIDNVHKSSAKAPTPEEQEAMIHRFKDYFQ